MGIAQSIMMKYSSVYQSSVRDYKVCLHFTNLHFKFYREGLHEVLHSRFQIKLKLIDRSSRDGYIWHLCPESMMLCSMSRWSMPGAGPGDSAGSTPTWAYDMYGDNSAVLIGWALLTF